MKLFLAFFTSLFTLFLALLAAFLSAVSLVRLAIFRSESLSFIYSMSSPTNHSGFDLGKIKARTGI